MKTSHLNPLLLSMVLLLGPFTAAMTEPASAPHTGAVVEKPGAPDEHRIRPIEEKITSLTQAMDQVIREVAEINTALRQANDEERAIFRDQRRRKYVEIRTRLEQLVRNTKELESLGQSSQEKREKAGAYVGQVSTWLKDDINDSLKLIAGLDEKIKTASEADAPELRQQIANDRQAADEEVHALFEKTDRMELLGLGSSDDLKFLDNPLVQRAENLVARPQYLGKQRDSLRKQVASAGEEEQKRPKERVSSPDGRIASTADNLKLTVEQMNERKLEAAEYKQILISATGEINKDIFQSKVALGLLQQSLNRGQGWLIDQGPQWAFN